MTKWQIGSVTKHWDNQKGEIKVSGEKHLKVATGCYINLYYEAGYSSITKTPVDIMIILPEYQGDDFDIDDVQERVESVLMGVFNVNDTVKGIEEELRDAFIDEDWQIFVKSTSAASYKSSD